MKKETKFILTGKHIAGELIEFRERFVVTDSSLMRNPILTVEAIDILLSELREIRREMVS